MKKTAYLFLLIFICSCSKDEIQKDLLIGDWRLVESTVQNASSNTEFGFTLITVNETEFCHTDGGTLCYEYEIDGDVIKFNGLPQLEVLEFIDNKMRAKALNVEPNPTNVYERQ